MNPSWVVIRERPWLTPAPLKSGAVAVTSYGLHVRVRTTGRIRLTAAYPDSTLLHLDTGREDVWPDLLEWLQTLAPKRKAPHAYVWVHGLGDVLRVLMGEMAGALALAPAVRIEGADVSWQAASVEGGTICLTEKSTKMTPSRCFGTSHRANVVSGRLYTASFTFGNSRPVHLADSAAYFRRPLGEHPMAAFVTGLARHDRETRRRRSLHPATAARLLGERIADLWGLLDVAPSPTPASAAARLFRRHYLPAPLAPVPAAVEEAARLSFHGGKVGCWLPKGPTEVTGVKVYDMRMAYGWALTQMPALLRGRWRPVSWRGGTEVPPLGRYGADDPLNPLLMPRGRASGDGPGLRLWQDGVGAEPNRVGLLAGRVPELRRAVAARPGFVCVTGRVVGCRWPCLQDHAGRWVSGEVRRLWVSAAECVEAVEAGELEVESYTGWLWDDAGDGGPVGVGGPTPWAAFVADMFRRRDLATDETRSVYKAAMVSLYGKTIQRTPIPPADLPEGVGVPWGRRVKVVARNGEAVDEPTYWRASSTYYPVVASLVTALVRVRVHQAEHAGRAVHTATDAVHCLDELPAEWCGRGLGQWDWVGGGTGYYGRANLWQVRGPNGFRRAAAAGVVGDPLAITDDLVGAM